MLIALAGAWMAIMETLRMEDPATHACAQGHLQAIGILHIPVTRTPSLHSLSVIVSRDIQVRSKIRTGFDTTKINVREKKKHPPPVIGSEMTMR